MRIIGGRHRGRPLAAPPGSIARPTADRAREALFNILAHGADVDLDGATVLDAFAGSGALGLEALSRGADHAVFLDSHPAATEAIRRNAGTLGETGRVTILRADAVRPPPAPRPCNLAFLDPPYGSGLAAPAVTALDRRGWLAADVLCVAEVAAGEAFEPPAGFTVASQRSYGAARFAFLRRAA